MTVEEYVGRELELFAYAIQWKKYWSSVIRAHLRGDVLEAGAGIGTNTPYLKSPQAASWTCLEPDALLAAQMREKFATDAGLRDTRVQIGDTQTIIDRAKFDAILYIDVLEHIPDDKAELERASRLLRRGGNLIVLSPAYSWLYTPFDRAIGHLRRYRKKTLEASAPRDCRLQKMIYLDSAGLLASSGNRLLLKRSMPTLAQILFWDRYLVPVSRVLDRLVFHGFGKSILGIWTKM
jgi:SAM-dependent methyltransferase